MADKLQKEDFSQVLWADAEIRFLDMQNNRTQPVADRAKLVIENPSMYRNKKLAYEARVENQRLQYNNCRTKAQSFNNSRLQNIQEDAANERRLRAKRMQRNYTVRRVINLFWMPLMLVASLAFAILSCVLASTYRTMTVFQILCIPGLFVMFIVFIAMMKKRNKGTVGRLIASIILTAIVGALTLVPILIEAQKNKEPYTYNLTTVNGIQGIELEQIGKNNAPTGKMTIDTIDGYPVLRIAKEALIYCDKVTELTVGDSVVFIEKGALKGLSALKKLDLPFVGENVLAGQNTVDSYSENLERGRIGYIFGDKSFKNSYRLERNQSYSDVSDFADVEAFYLPKDLETVNVRGGNIMALSFFGAYQIESVTFSSSANPEAVGAYAFQASGIKNIVLPQTVNRIYKFAFALNSSLKSVSLSQDLKNIDEYAFWYAEDLTQLTFKGEIPTMGFNVFKKANESPRFSVPYAYYNAYKNYNWNRKFGIMPDFALN